MAVAKNCELFHSRRINSFGSILFDKRISARCHDFWVARSPSFALPGQPDHEVSPQVGIKNKITSIRSSRLKTLLPHRRTLSPPTTMLEQFSLCAEFLRCRDVKQLVRTCKDVDDIQVLSMKTTMAAAQKELFQDIRDEAAEKRARHERGDVSPAYSYSSFGFSIDSDGHWLEHDRVRNFLGH